MKSIKYEICVYCGDGATTRDHWRRPISFDFVKRPSSKFSRSFGETVPCCHQCNSFLGNLLIPNIQERAFYLLKKLKNRKVTSKERIKHLALVSASSVIIYEEKTDEDLWPCMPSTWSEEETDKQRILAIRAYNRTCRKRGKIAKI